jgi:hypothetical protein
MQSVCEKVEVLNQEAGLVECAQRGSHSRSACSKSYFVIRITSVVIYANADASEALILNLPLKVMQCVAQQILDIRSCRQTARRQCSVMLLNLVTVSRSSRIVLVMKKDLKYPCDEAASVARLVRRRLQRSRSSRWQTIPSTSSDGRSDRSWGILAQLIRYEACSKTFR